MKAEWEKRHSVLNAGALALRKRSFFNGDAPPERMAATTTTRARRPTVPIRKRELIEAGSISTGQL